MDAGCGRTRSRSEAEMSAERDVTPETWSARVPEARVHPPVPPNVATCVRLNVSQKSSTFNM